MKEIPLTKGQVALVDDADYDELSKHKWYSMWNKCTRSFYAMRHGRSVDGKRPVLEMHRVILGASTGQVVDHINHDTRDNRRENLRICTYAQNLYNQRPKPGGSSAYKGVYWNKLHGKWMARIRHNAGRMYIGLFTDEIAAAVAYDAKARELHGEFAYVNFPMGNP